MLRPGYMIWKILFLFCLSRACLSVVNFTLRCNFWTLRDREFIFCMHSPSIKPFQMMTLWPWIWPLGKNMPLSSVLPLGDRVSQKHLFMFQIASLFLYSREIINHLRGNRCTTKDDKWAIKIVIITLSIHCVL